MPAPLPKPSDVRTAYREELHHGQQMSLVAWIAFTVTFITVRIITHRIRDKQRDDKQGGLKNLSVGGIHLHHYMWGLLSVSGVAGVVLRRKAHEVHPALAILYGIGMALIVDEFALLLDLKDVYWAKEGRWSVDLAVALISGMGTGVVGLPILRRLQRDRAAAL